MRTLSLLCAGALAVSAMLGQAALAQPAPPPGVTPAAPDGAVPPPPPPPGALADADPAPPPPPPGKRPPPPPGAAVMIDRGPNGIVRIDVHCAQRDTTKDCADIASRLFGETSAPVAGK